MAQLYDKPVSQLLKQMVTSFALTPKQEFTRQGAIAWFASQYPKVKRATVAAHLIKMTTNDATRFHYHARAGVDDLLFRTQPGRYRLYDPLTDPQPIGLGPSTDKSAGPPPSGESDDNDEAADVNGADPEFAYERDLRNYLAKNLGVIEQGLQLYDDGEGVTGLEFPVGGRRIDILAVDRRGDYVVVELKVSQAYDRVIGQLLRYMGWIEQNQADPGQGVRGVIVASEISDDLRLACSRIDGVNLYKYALSVTLEPVSSKLTVK